MTRTVWTRDEKRQVFENAQAICLTNPRITNKALLTEAQQVLPMGRRIKVNDQRVFSYKDRLNAARAEAEQMLRNVSPSVIEEPSPQEEPRRIDGIGDLFELLVDAIADRIVQKLQAEPPKPDVIIEKGFVEDREPAFGRGWLDELEKLSIRSKQAKSRAPSVLVIGLNGCQMETIKTYKPDLNYTFATAEQALSRHVFNCDHTILMTKFINHSVQSKYRKHPNLHYCNGGVSELKTLLHGLFHKEAA